MTAPPVTAEEFFSAYATRSGVPPLQILEAGRVVATCACGTEDCEGWQVTPADCLGPGDNVSITAEDYSKPGPRESDQPRCGHCGRYVRWSLGYGWWECSKGCMVPTMSDPRKETP